MKKWKVFNPHKSTNYIVSDERGANGRIADTIESLSDASLISAAPDMFGLLISAHKRLVELGEGESNDLLLPRIEAALLKARGV